LELEKSRADFIFIFVEISGFSGFKKAVISIVYSREFIKIS
jgi:hypothetical protein